MAKAKSPMEATVDYFQGIKYFVDEGKLIVLLPEGLKVFKAELKDDKIELKLHIEGLDNLFVVVKLDAHVKTEDYLILQAEDAKGFGQE